MAFPTIPTGTQVVTGTQTGTSPTRTFPSLTGLTKNAGDLLIAIVVGYQSTATANAVFSAWGGSFTEFADQSATTGLCIGAAYKFSTGSETGTFTVTQAATITGDAAFLIMAIPGAHASTPPEGGTAVRGTSTAGSVGTLDPAGWATEDTLWIAVGGSGEDSAAGSWDAIASAPANYTNIVGSAQSQDAIGGCSVAVAFRQLNASASGSVGAFTFDLSNARNTQMTLAVRPAAVVTKPRAAQVLGQSANRAASFSMPFSTGIVRPVRASGAGSPTYATTILATSGLVSYWRMDDSGSTLTDSKGSLNGTIGAAVTKGAASLLTNDTANASMDFTGAANSWCSGITTPGSGFTGITWEAWCRPDTVPADGTFRTIFIGWASTGNYIQMDGDGYEANITTNVGGTTKTDAATNVFNAGTTIHLALTWSAADPNLRFYKNGVQVVSQAASGATITNSANGTIGGTTSSTDLFDGRIDDVALYNVAVPAATLLAHYNLGITAP